MFKKTLFSTCIGIALISSLFAGANMFSDNPRTLLEPFNEMDLISPIDYNQYTLKEQKREESTHAVSADQVKDLFSFMVFEEESAPTIRINPPVALQTNPLNDTSRFPSSLAITN